MKKQENENKIEFRNDESCKNKKNVVEFTEQNERNEWKLFKNGENHSITKERGGKSYGKRQKRDKS
jgi:hypothetical protein